MGFGITVPVLFAAKAAESRGRGESREAVQPQRGHKKRESRSRAGAGVGVDDKKYFFLRGHDDLATGRRPGLTGRERRGK